MKMEKDENLPYMVIPVEDETGKSVECEVLAIYPAEGRQYIAMMDKNNPEAEVWLYRFVPLGEEEFNIEDIESDEEFERAETAFNDMVDSAEIDAVTEE